MSRLAKGRLAVPVTRAAAVATLTHPLPPQLPPQHILPLPRRSSLLKGQPQHRCSHRRLRRSRTRLWQTPALQPPMRRLRRQLSSLTAAARSWHQTCRFRPPRSMQPRCTDVSSHVRDARAYGPEPQHVEDQLLASICG